jgi:RNA polymerase sigma factor (sigma-70 family)
MRTGDRDSDFRVLFDAAYAPLLAYALRRTPDPADAEEAVAETMLVAWRRRAEIPKGAELPWLYGVARRVLANQRRARGRRARLASVLSRVRRVRPDAADAAEASDEVRAVLAALARLSAADQEVLRLATWEELSNDEIALALGCSANAVAIRLHRARRRLRQELMKETAPAVQEVVETTR